MRIVAVILISVSELSLDTDRAYNLANVSPPTAIIASVANR